VQVRATERTGNDLLLDLRELPNKSALGLRSQIAMQLRSLGLVPAPELASTPLLACVHHAIVAGAWREPAVCTPMRARRPVWRALQPRHTVSTCLSSP